jgi:hypothetical protein
MISQDITKELSIAQASDRAKNSRAWLAFVLCGAALYLGVYGFAEQIVRSHGERSRLFMIATARQPVYDFVILGASHAMPLGFEDVNEHLARAAGGSVINLSIEGGGIIPARFMLEYFLANHDAKKVVYVLDSFVFYSRQWNEERINDPNLVKRAPFDIALMACLWRHTYTRGLIPGYLSGFFKINDADRFKRDISDNEANKFERVYRAKAIIDRPRLAYLYPQNPDQLLITRYLAEFQKLAESLHQRGINFVVLRPPLPDRVSKNLHGEEIFNAEITKILEPYGFQLHDFAPVANDDAYFFDTDHLNKSGVLTFIDTYLAPLLREP